MEYRALNVESFIHSPTYLASISLSVYYVLGITVMNKVPALQMLRVCGPTTPCYIPTLRQLQGKVCIAQSIQIFQRGKLQF